MIKVLIVGQTPPPYGGQAIMIEEILRLRYPGLQLIHARMDFSENMEDMGKVKLKKLTKLIKLIAQIIWLRISTGANILYYPPAGPNRVPVIRDLIILISIRWMFKKTVFHFHAGGLTEIYPQLSTPLQILFKIAYSKPDATIRLSELNPEDGKNLASRQEFVIPYGIEDPTKTYPISKRGSRSQPLLLYVAVLRESKGLLVLLESCRRLLDRGIGFSLEVMGRFESKEFEIRVQKSIEDNGLKDQNRRFNLK